MRRFCLLMLLVCAALAGGCAAATGAQLPNTDIAPPTSAPTKPIVSIAAATAAPDNHADSSETAPQAGPERTPDPASEMLVTGPVTAVLDRAIRVQDDGLGKELIITMLDRAEYADGVSREFAVGNRVSIISSNRLAKTLPERAAAVLVLAND